MSTHFASNWGVAVVVVYDVVVDVVVDAQTRSRGTAMTPNNSLDFFSWYSEGASDHVSVSRFQTPTRVVPLRLVCRSPQRPVAMANILVVFPSNETSLL